jgi:hypothetical protein
MNAGGKVMENFAELVWFVAYVVQMIALLAGVSFVLVISCAALYEVFRRKVGKSRPAAPPVALSRHAERV